jgi:hypothetical protein
MIIEVLGWKFIDQADADNYIAAIDSRFGFPNEQTLHYTMYVVGSYNNNPVYYLLDDLAIHSDLGEPYLFFLDSVL